MAETDLSAALPDYEVGGELGRGGFGVVRAGRHRQLKREVAIKELPAALASDATVRARFATEARVLASLSHPHIVPIYDYVERDGLCLLVMEYLPGGTVWSRFKEQGFGQETTCAVVMAVCTGLHYAHQRGVLHRDVKPENLLFNADHVLKITDFGIAKVVGGSETLATRGGDILGTPAYMAPEQAEGRELTAAADVYATGVMLYELLSGHLPYSEDGGPLAIVYRHVYEDPIPLLDVAPDVLPSLAAVTMRALARSTADRYQTAEAFGVAIGEAVTGSWGVDWLGRSELQIVDPGPVSESAKRPSGSGAAGAGAGAPSGGAGSRARATAPPAAARAPGTVAVPSPTSGTSTRRPPPPPAAGEPPPVIPTPAAVPAGNATVPAPAHHQSRIAARVRPKHDEHVVGGGNLDQADLVPLRHIIELPGRPLPHVLAALALLLAALAVGFLGISSAARTRTLAEGVATVGGADVGRDATVTLDLSKPLEIRLSQLPPEAAGATRAQLAMSVAGVPVPASTTETLAATDQGLVATVEATTARYVVAGESTAELRLLSDTGVVLRHEFAAKSKQSAFLTIPGVLVVALLLFILAYVESLLRPLRRGRRRVTGIVGMLILGAALGLVITAFGWLLGGAEPTVTTALVAVLLAAAAALAAALASIRVGQRARIKPRKAAESRAAARSAAA